MAKNPMQKKATNAFLLGMVITLIIVAAIGAAAYMLYFLPKQNANKNSGMQTAMKEVYVIKQPVKSGEDIIVGVNAELQKIETGIIEAVDPTGTKSKIDLELGTIITSSMIYIEDENVTPDVRLVEYNMITLPVDINIGDCIDVRITLPSGQDCIVVSKKTVISLNGDTIGLNLSEDEMLMMNSAIVEGYQITASNIYITKYVEPGNQEKAIPTYPVNDAVKALIEGNPNVVAEARQAFAERYNKVKGLRGYINLEQEKYQETALDNIEARIVEQIQKAKEERQQYLTGIVE